MRLNTISKKIWFGYLFIALVLLLSGFMVHQQSSSLQERSQKMRDVREPTVESSFELLTAIYGSQSALQHAVLLKDRDFLKRWEEFWESEIDPSLGRLKTLSSSWVDAQSTESFQAILEQVDSFKKEQEDFKNSFSVTKLSSVSSSYRSLVETARDLRADIRVLVERQRKLMNEDVTYQAKLMNNLNLSLIALIALCLFICVLMGGTVEKAVTKPIERTIDFANAITGGDYESSLDVGGTMEMDQLKTSLEAMRAGLEMQNWVSQAKIMLDEAVRGVGNIRQLATAAIAALAQSAQAEVGVLYLVEGPKLNAVGGFARPKGIRFSSEMEIGQGLAGQAAADKQPHFVSGSKERTLSLDTFLGEMHLQDVLAVPLLFQDQVVGVMEFASAKPMSSRARNFLIETSSSLAVTVDATIKTDQIQNLLHETQAQSEELREQQEELQSRQEELEANNEELEEQQAILTEQKRALDDQNHELNQVSKYKSEFLANMSHELRTPLNSQLILSGLLIENKEGNLTEKQLQYVQTIQATGQNLLQLINDILDLSKVEAGKLTLDVQEVRLKEVVEALRDDFMPLVEKKGLRFDLEVSPNVPERATLDPLRLTQILRNFISNALKFTERGKVGLKIERLSDYLIFRVRDTGVGIPEEKQQAIFEAFEQVDTSISRKYGGTGLGLAISHKLARLLGGSIRVESEVGKGSTFSLFVPLAPAVERPAPSTPVKRPSPSGKVKKVLVVDDDSLQREEIMRLIGSDHVESIGVATATAGYDVLQGPEAVDCMVLDLGLPDMGGFELLEKIRKNQDLECPPVIIYTARELTREEEELLRKHSNAIIIKGVKSSERLLDEVSLVVQQEIKEAPEDSQQKQTPFYEKEERFKDKTVLVVDDDVRNIFALCSALEEKGLKVVIARNGKEAVDFVKENPHVDLVLMDIMMPVMDGYEAMKRIRAEEKNQRLPIIALTAKAMKEDRELCLEAGASDYLAKPIDMKRLLTLLRTWLSQEV